MSPESVERVDRCIGSCERVKDWLDGQVDTWVVETLEHVLADLRELKDEGASP